MQNGKETQNGVELTQQHPQAQPTPKNQDDNADSKTYVVTKDIVMEDQIKGDQTVNLELPQEPKPTHRVIKYRADIDGLRAVAISCVLIYHAFPTKLPGGYIGVDVFFVISGFLISQIIIKEVEKQKFTYSNFYIRRIKRIYPALIIVLSFTLFIIHKFAEFDLIIFSLNTLDSALAFAANIQILLHQQGYFDADIRGNPLLHLWSLGVEEQFYIVWPCLLSVILKFFKKRALVILSVYAVVSFIFSIVSVYVNPKFAFYFPLCRFWQMAVGGILGFLNLSIRNKYINNALSIVGIFSIIMGSFLLNDNSLFPGFWALVPTLSCAGIIQARSQSLFNKYVLSNRVCVFIGKISYSLYLWHWPLLVFSRNFYPAGSNSIMANTYFIILLTFVLTILTYYIFENPIRKVKSKKVVLVLVLLMCVIGIVSIPIRLKSQHDYYSQDDIGTIQLLKSANKQLMPGPGDYVQYMGRRIPNFSVNKNRVKPDNVDKLRSAYIDQRWDVAHGGQYLLEKPVTSDSKYAEMLQTPEYPCLHNFAVANEGSDNQLFIIGDSHAMKISYHFQQLWRLNKMKNTLDEFPTILTAIRRGVVAAEWNGIYNFTRNLVHKYKPQRILFAWNWIYYFCRDLKAPLSTPPNCEQGWVGQYIPEFVNLIHEMEALGVDVTTIGVDVNYIKLSPANMFDDDGVIEQNTKPIRYSEYREKYKFIYDSVESALNNGKIKWIDTTKNWCWEDLCQVVSPKGWGAFIDIDHMGKFYSRHWFTIFDYLTQF